MKTIWIVLILGACLTFSSQGFANFCERTKLEGSPENDDEESLRDYLREYATTQKCTEDKLNTWWKTVELDADSIKAVDDTTRRQHMLGAWNGIADTLDGLTDGATNPENGAPLAMKGNYRAMARRARAALDQLANFQSDDVPSNAFFARETWKVNPNFLLNENDQLPILDFLPALAADCEVRNSRTCEKAIADGKIWILAWTKADRLSGEISNKVIALVAKQVDAKDKLWNTYLYDSKPMLPFDFIFTDWMNKGYTDKKSDQYPNGFRGPPDTQWFLLHPSFGVEYASAAKDGEQLEPVLYLELVGANRWNEADRWFNKPYLNKFSGFSVIASYADRDGIKDTGYGVLLTFDNVYSVGITQYGSETGVFFSLDMANLFRNKYKPRYEKYKEQTKNVLKALQPQ